MPKTGCPSPRQKIGEIWVPLRQMAKSGYPHEILHHPVIFSEWSLNTELKTLKMYFFCRKPPKIYILITVFRCEPPPPVFLFGVDFNSYSRTFLKNPSVMIWCVSTKKRYSYEYVLVQLIDNFTGTLLIDWSKSFDCVAHGLMNVYYCTWS